MAPAQPAAAPWGTAHGHRGDPTSRRPDRRVASSRLLGAARADARGSTVHASIANTRRARASSTAAPGRRPGCSAGQHPVAALMAGGGAAGVLAVGLLPGAPGGVGGAAPPAAWPSGCLGHRPGCWSRYHHGSPSRAHRGRRRRRRARRRRRPRSARRPVARRARAAVVAATAVSGSSSRTSATTCFDLFGARADTVGAQPTARLPPVSSSMSVSAASWPAPYAVRATCAARGSRCPGRVYLVAGGAAGSLTLLLADAGRRGWAGYAADRHRQGTTASSTAQHRCYSTPARDMINSDMIVPVRRRAVPR